MLVAACAALEARKTVREHAAAQEALEGRVHERRCAALITRHLRKRCALLGHEAVQHGLRGVARHVLGRRTSLRGAGEHGRCARKARAEISRKSFSCVWAHAVVGRWRVADGRLPAPRTLSGEAQTPAQVNRPSGPRATPAIHLQSQANAHPSHFAPAKWRAGLRECDTERSAGLAERAPARTPADPAGHSAGRTARYQPAPPGHDSPHVRARAYPFGSVTTPAS